jgi:hypothetical protein
MIEQPDPPPPKYPVPPAQLEDLIVRRQALHFGHIGGATGRHFIFYVDAAALLQGPELPDALITRVDRWRSLGPDERPLCVWYPTPEPKVPRPALTLASRLRQARDYVTEVRPIPRQHIQGGWRFPSGVNFSVAGADVVIIDWGAIEGTTVTELVRLAAGAGAERILVCLCLSQLRPETEWHLRALRRVAATRWEVPEKLFDMDLAHTDRPSQPLSKEVEVSIEVEFLSALRVPAFSHGDCPLCRQLETLTEDGGHTDRIKAFVNRQHTERLHLKPRDEAVGEPLVALDGNRLSGEATAAMLAQRRELESALRSSRVRWRLVSWLRDLAEPGDVSDEILNLLRLLSVETPWLRRPPLVFDEVRRLVADMATAVAVSPTAGASDLINAITVLRTCSKMAFARNAEAIYLNVHERAEVLDHLLYGIYTYIDRPYLQTEEVWRPLVEALEAIRERVAQGDIPQRNGSREVDVLHDRAKVRWRVAQLADMPDAVVFNELARSFGATYTTHGVADSVRRLEPNLHREFVKEVHASSQHDDDVRTRLASLERDIAAGWRQIERFLGDHVIAQLRHIRPVLNSWPAREELGTQWAALDRLLSEDLGVAEWPIALLVRAIECGTETFETFDREFSWLAEIMLRPNRLGAGRGYEPARLVRLLRDVRSDVHAVLALAQSMHTYEHVAQIDLSGVPDDGTNAFFPSSSLRELLGEVFANVESHYHPGDDTDHGTHPGRARIEVTRMLQADDVVLSIVNTDTAPRSGRRELLAKQGEALLAFGGGLSHGRVADPPLSYWIEITLKRMPS